MDTESTDIKSVITDSITQTETAIKSEELDKEAVKLKEFEINLYKVRLLKKLKSEYPDITDFSQYVSDHSTEIQDFLSLLDEVKKYI